MKCWGDSCKGVVVVVLFFLLLRDFRFGVSIKLLPCCCYEDNVGKKKAQHTHLEIHKHDTPHEGQHSQI